MIDVTHQISAVRRAVGSRVLEAGEARVVTVSQAYAADVEDGWDLGLPGLAQHLATGATVPPEVAAWAISQDGVRFMTESSEAWRAASVAAGTDEAAARAAAERTTAAYTAVPES